MRSVSWKSAWSVTRLLNAKFGSPVHVPPEALLRGTLIHEWCAALDLGCPFTAPDELKGWCEAYKQFTYDFTPSWDRVEEMTDSEDLGYHGIVDRTGHLRGRMTVADIKSGAPRKPQDPLQLAAYTMLLFPTSYSAIQRVGIYLRKDGTYKTVAYTKASDYATWQNILKEARHGKIRPDQDHRRLIHRSPPTKTRDRDGGTRHMGGVHSAHSEQRKLSRSVRGAQGLPDDAESRSKTLQEVQGSHQRTPEDVAG
jgi:hypothetical protein